MVDRRRFLKTTLVMTAGCVAGKSATTSASAGPFPTGVVYTKEDPGRWAKKVGSHAPEITVDGSKVKIVTKHPMSENHYIVRHTLVSADGKVVGEKTFRPTDRKALSIFDIPADAGTHFYATSFCNLHDFWVVEFTITGNS